MTRAQRWADLAERAAWTLLQAGAGEGAVQLLDLPQWAVVPIAGALAAIKAALAQKFGNGTAATLPADLEPTVPVGRHAAADEL